MGHYTDAYMDFRLRADTPTEVIDFLRTQIRRPEVLTDNNYEATELAKAIIADAQHPMRDLLVKAPNHWPFLFGLRNGVKPTTRGPESDKYAHFDDTTRRVQAFFNMRNYAEKDQPTPYKLLGTLLLPFVDTEYMHFFQTRYEEYCSSIFDMFDKDFCVANPAARDDNHGFGYGRYEPTHEEEVQKEREDSYHAAFGQVCIERTP